MTLEPGQTLGPYEILESAGAGGMGEVYKARDTRLDRTVAIKILPHRTAHNADLRARFEREAKAISSLNHPNICTLHDIGHENDIDYLVMEYIEGESLSERLKKGPMSVDDALQIALQIAEALDSAHRKGLVHRDLKPANVMLTRDGAKLLDFGLAKLQVAGGVVEGISGITQTTPLTGTGTIIGTIQYMSPEQLEGSEADHRSDIFAFGAVLYEMISGQKPFEGKSQASIIAAIIEREPTPLSSLRPMSPPGLDRLVKKCLQKDPDARWQSARDMADEIRWLSTGSQAGVAAPVSKRRKVRSRLAWSLVGLFVLSTLVLSWLWVMRPEPEVRVRRFVIDPAVELQRVRWPRISPDGTTLAFLGTDSTGKTQIWMRPMSSMTSSPMPGTEGAGRPFWSPDSKWLGFFVGGNQLKKVPVTGGPAQLLGETERGYDGSWGPNDQILFDGSREDSIRAFSASGGTARSITTIDRETGEVYHAWPECLPDDKHFLYLVNTDTSDNRLSYQLVVGSYDSDERKPLIEVGSKVEYTKSGYLLYVRDNTLLAHRFDVGKLELVGEPVPLVQNIPPSEGSGGANFSVSDEGTLVYQQSHSSGASQLVMVDRSGNPLDTLGPPGIYGDFSMSPDERYVAYAKSESSSGQSDIWIYDRRRNVSTRLTFDEADEFNPIWTPDGREVIYTLGSLPRVKPMIRAANGTSEARPLLDQDSVAAVQFDIAENNKTISIGEIQDFKVDIYAWDRGTPWADRRPLVTTDFNEFMGEFSPDGRFLAYVSQESEPPELYLLRLKGESGRWQVSFGGGFVPRWKADGTELFYFSGRRVMSAKIEYSTGVEIGKPEELFEFRSVNRQFGFSDYDVTADGQQFLINEVKTVEDHPGFVVVQDWWVELAPDR